MILLRTGAREPINTGFVHNQSSSACGEVAMGYALMILEQPGQRNARTEAEGRELYRRMLQFSEDLKSRGLLTVAHSLKSDADGARVSMRNSQTTVVDGPFAESKEMIGGFFLLTCEVREQAIAIAQTCPAASWATVEVRELGPCYS
jgi:hypothetical protein